MSKKKNLWVGKTKHITLSVIIPFRDDPKLRYLMQRLETLCAELPTRDDIEFIVVDSGSNPNSAAKCQRLCKQYNVRYLYQDTIDRAFSIGEARDFGVVNAEGEAVTFLDVDLRVDYDFWDRLIDFMDIFGISKQKKSFFVIPALYLTEEGTVESDSIDVKNKFQYFYLRWLYGDKHLTQNLAPCSSVMVVDRLHYLSLGGHRSEFRGHGFEDFEFLHRLAIEDGRKISRPENYYKDSGSWDINTYNSLRALFSLFGRPALLANLFVVHLWHPRPKQNSFYSHDLMKQNREIWVDFFKEYDKRGFGPEPLVDNKYFKNKILFIGGIQQANVSRTLRDIFPILGDIIYLSEYTLVDDKGVASDSIISDFISHNKINKVLFANPYGNPIRLQIYNWCRKTNFPFIVYERGALPDSWFFDDKGFNADSESYNERFWNKPILEEERIKIINFIRNTISGDATLEKQGSKIGAKALSQRLKIGRKKVLFVPLQRPSDTVMKYFYANGDAVSFIQMIDTVAQKMAKLGWVVLCKKHPLEVNTPPLQHATYVPDDTHFIDLIELGDAVALVNSGVGVYAMMMGKPCFVFGEAFYQFDGINTHIKNNDGDMLCKYLASGDTKVDIERVYRFIHYLTNKFYSFAKSKTYFREEKDGSLRSGTSHLDFYHISLPNQQQVKYNYPNSFEINQEAPIFERFALDLAHKKNSAKKLQTINTVTPSVDDKQQKTPVDTEYKNSTPNEAIRDNLWFAVYSKIYGIFLSKRQKVRLLSSPIEFFTAAKHPFSKFGRFMARDYLRK